VRTALQTDHAEWISNDLCTLPRVLHQPMHTVRQQPARKLQQLATDVHTDAGDPRTTQRRFARTIAGCIYRPNQTTAVRTTRAYRRTRLCNSRAYNFSNCRNTTPERAYKNCGTMAAHDASKAVRASVITVPSFRNQNGLMYGVIRRQDIDKRGLTIGCKTALVSNNTAITLQRVSGQASAEPDRPTEAHFAASS